MDRDVPRTEGVLISGHDPVWVVGLCGLLGCCALGMGALMAMRRPDPPAMLMLAVGTGLIVGALVVAVVLRQRRRFLHPTEEGFIYTTAYGDRTFHDDDVMCVSLSSTENYFWGNLQSVTRRFIIWVETSALPERIVCISHLKPPAPDPLQGFVLRIIEGLHRAAQDAYEQGERVEGDGWALERGQLLLKSSKSTAVFPIPDLAAVDIVDEQVNIWRMGQDLPIGRIPVRTANAHLLILMLSNLIPKRSNESEADLQPGQLGRVIFERRLGSKSADVLGWLLVSLLILLTLGAVVSAVFERRARRRMRTTVTAIVLGSLAAAGSSLLELKRRSRFRRHAFGIYQRGMFTERKLRFNDIANFSYVAIRRYSHGIYNGTSLTLKFVPMPSLNAKPIFFRTNIHNADAELDRLRDEVSGTIAERMLECWQRNGHCPWMPFLNFQGEGLEYRPLTFTGRKQPIHIPFSSIANFDITDGTFHVWVEGQRKSTINEETTQPNFYPGLLFFSKLLNRELSREAVLEDEE